MNEILSKLLKINNIIIIISLIFLIISSVNASDIDNTILTDENLDINNTNDISSTLIEQINNSNVNEEINIKPGHYNINNILITKNITLQGDGNPRDIIFDGNELSSILLIRSDDVHLTLRNITFINGLTDNFGGAISIETGHVYVDNCIFINNTATENTNAGAISNYGTAEKRATLMVNNSLFINNVAYHDGGAITTCYASSNICNSVFINNSADRDGGAIRVSIYGYGEVSDCIFMYNYAKEWGGAYYSWSGTSNIKRCIFMNNTAGTNGGAVMVSGNLNLESSIIVNNTGGETGGSFYIQQPMYNAITDINVHNNLITNNTSPYGKEIFIKWKDTENLYTSFDNNDWGSENPNDSSVIDPDNVTSRSKVTTTTKSTLLNDLNLNLLNKYADLINGYFPTGYLDQINKTHDKKENNENLNHNSADEKSEGTVHSNISGENKDLKTNASQNIKQTKSKNKLNIGNSTTYGNKKAYELNETTKSIAKTTNLNIHYFIILIIFISLILIGYKSKKIK